MPAQGSKVRLWLENRPGRHTFICHVAPIVKHGQSLTLLAGIYCAGADGMGGPQVSRCRGQPYIYCMQA